MIVLTEKKGRKVHLSLYLTKDSTLKTYGRMEYSSSRCQLMWCSIRCTHRLLYSPGRSSCTHCVEVHLGSRAGLYESNERKYILALLGIESRCFGSPARKEIVGPGRRFLNCHYPNEWHHFYEGLNSQSSNMLNNSGFFAVNTWGVQVLRYPNFFLGNGSR